MESYVALFEAVARPLLIGLFSAIALIGLLALISPRAFSRVVAKCNSWVDTEDFFSAFRKRIDVGLDQFALSHSRLMGTATLVGTAILGYACFL